MAKDTQLPKKRLNFNWTAIVRLAIGGDVKDVSAAKVRDLLGMSQTEFARMLGISPCTLRNWERPGYKPSTAAATLLKIAERHPDIVQEVTLATS